MHKMNIALCALIMAATGTSTIFPMFKSMEARRKIQGVKQDVKAAAVPAVMAFYMYQGLFRKITSKLERYGLPCIAFAFMYLLHRQDLTDKLLDAIKKEDGNGVTELLLHGANPRNTANRREDDDEDYPHTKTYPLSEACSLATIGIARRLLEHGACPNAGNLRIDRYSAPPRKYNFPLPMAAQGCDVPLCTLLIAHGADVNQLDEYQRTPLGGAFCRLNSLSFSYERDRAAFNTAVDMCALLIDSGANIKRDWGGNCDDILYLFPKGPFLKRLHLDDNDAPAILPLFTLNNGMNAHEFLVRKALSKYELHELDEVCAQHQLDYKELSHLWAEENAAMMDGLSKEVGKGTSFRPELCNEIMSFLVEQPVKKQLSIRARQKIMLEAMLERISTESTTVTTPEARGEPKESKEPIRE